MRQFYNWNLNLPLMSMQCLSEVLTCASFDQNWWNCPQWNQMLDLESCDTQRRSTLTTTMLALVGLGYAPSTDDSLMEAHLGYLWSCASIAAAKSHGATP